MVQAVDNRAMYALLLIPILAILCYLAVRYGVDSRPGENVRHRPNLL